MKKLASPDYLDELTPLDFIKYLRFVCELEEVEISDRPENYGLHIKFTKWGKEHMFCLEYTSSRYGIAEGLMKEVIRFTNAIVKQGAK